MPTTTLTYNTNFNKDHDKNKETYKQATTAATTTKNTDTTNIRKKTQNEQRNKQQRSRAWQTDIFFLTNTKNINELLPALIPSLGEPTTGIFSLEKSTTKTFTMEYFIQCLYFGIVDAARIEEEFQC